MPSSRTHTVSGGGGLALHVEETGKEGGPAILFIHGFSQCRLSWRKQLHSDLADDFRLVAMDLRGHGLSEKPRDVYGEQKLWADDVHAVIETLALDRPILCGWSYGGMVMSDYLRHYGEAAIGGTHWISAIARIGDPALRAGLIGGEFLSLAPGFFTENVEESVAALERFARLCVHGELAADDLYFMLGFSTIVPPHVRLGMFSRALDNDDVIRGMRKPMLLTYGERDPIVLPAVAEQIARSAPHAKLSLYPDTGHSPFWEAPERFNRELRQFAQSVFQEAAATR